jgi:hypothetical protein
MIEIIFKTNLLHKILRIYFSYINTLGTFINYLHALRLRQEDGEEVKKKKKMEFKLHTLQLTLMVIHVYLWLAMVKTKITQKSICIFFFFSTTRSGGRVI